MKRLPLTVLALVLVLVASSVFLLSANASAPATTIQPQEGENGTQVDGPLSPSSILFNYQGNLADSSGQPINQPAMPMTFKLYSVGSGGSACWTENHTGGNAVNVQDGLFNVLLGQLTAIPTSCLGSNIYLEVAVNGETLSPRELFTSVAYAVEASTLPDGASAKGSLTVPGNLTSSGEIRAQNPNAPTASVFLGWGNDIARIRVGGDGPGAQNGFDIQTVGDRSLLRVLHNGRVGISSPNPQHGRLEITDPAVPLAFREEGQTGAGSLWRTVLDSRYLRIDASQNGNDFGGYITPIAMYSSGEVRLGGIVRTAGPLTVNGNTTINGNLDLNGSCSLSAPSGSSQGANALVANEDCTPGSITSGAYIEANLQTPEERRAERVERFEQGDLLCWSPADERLELCAVANDRLVMAVVDTNGKPIVIGAEPVKVVGSVQAGDILVSSDAPGYAMVNNDPKPGTVIGQALEASEGETGLIRAMVRKW